MTAVAQVDDTRIRPLPPGVTEADLDRAVERFTEALGSDRVLTSEEALDEFRDPFAPATWDDYTASAVVMPETVEEIQEVVQIANELRFPLWTHSAGMNNGYGGPAPRVRGSVIVSLRRMNRVLEINEECAYAVVEPGVRWFDLYSAVQQGGHKLMVSIPDLGWGSVVGNYLENGATYLPYGNDMAGQCGMEVVLANGEVMRTGMGAMPGNRSWHVYKRSLGPTPGPALHAVELRHRHEARRVADAAAGVLHAALAPRLERGRPGAGGRHAAAADARPHDRERAADLEHDALASVISSRAPWYEGEDPIPDAVIDTMARELEIGRWMMRFALYGDESVVDLRFRKIKEAFEQIPGAEVWGRSTRRTRSSRSSTPSSRSRAAFPTSASTR